MKNNKEISRSKQLSKKIIFVDGIAGCGKTLFSQIIASFDKVEILNYAFEVEWICRLFYLKKINNDAAQSMIKMLIDLKIYGNMMGRDVNFRYSDLSGVFQNPKPLRYFKRIFGSGDLDVPRKIDEFQPILNFTTHDLLPLSKPIFEGLGKDILFLDIERHPLFMVIQQTLNMERLLNNPRNIAIYFKYNNYEIPSWAEGWEELYLKSNFVEKAIFYMYHQIDLREKFHSENKKLLKSQIITIPFEKFVKNPYSYLSEIEDKFELKVTKLVQKVMKKQKVPRKNIVDGIPLSIYKRCGWTPPDKNLTEKEEYLKRRQFIIDQGANKFALETIDNLSFAYEKKHCF